MAGMSGGFEAAKKKWILRKTQSVRQSRNLAQKEYKRIGPSRNQKVLCGERKYSAETGTPNPLDRNGQLLAQFMDYADIPSTVPISRS